MNRLKQILIPTIAIFLLTSTLSFAAEILGNNISLRRNAGAYYPVITVLNSGDQVTILEDDEFWKKVKTTSGRVGYVSANAFSSASSTIDYGMMAKGQESRTISKSMITAAVKGFYETKIKSTHINKNLMDRPFVEYFTPESYEMFKTLTFSKRWKHKKFLKMYQVVGAGSFKVDERLAVTSAYTLAKLSSAGISENRYQTSYVNKVAQLVAESTEYYDMPVCVHVVKSKDIFANATPIGAIIISEGMLDIIQSEHELAGLIGHEIAHVTLGHGQKETKTREPLFKAEDAFAEMDAELGTDNELDDFADDMYEHAVKGRKAAYEGQADIRGAIYARRAGYDPSGMISIMVRIKTMIEAKTDHSDINQEMSHWLPYSFGPRIKALNQYIGQYLETGKHSRKFENRYKKYIY